MFRSSTRRTVLRADGQHAGRMAGLIASETARFTRIVKDGNVVIE